MQTNHDIPAHISHLAGPTGLSFSNVVSVSGGDGVWHFVAGQLGVSRDEPQPSSFADEVMICCRRIEHLLAKVGARREHIVSTRIYLTELDSYNVFSEIRSEFFGENPPASAAVQVSGLLLNARIEIEAVAYAPNAPAAM